MVKQPIGLSNGRLQLIQERGNFAKGALYVAFESIGLLGAFEYLLKLF